VHSEQREKLSEAVLLPDVVENVERGASNGQRHGQCDQGPLHDILAAFLARA